MIQGYKDLGACRGNAAPKVLEQGSDRSNHAKIRVPDQARHPSPPEVDRGRDRDIKFVKTARRNFPENAPCGPKTFCTGYKTKLFDWT